MPMPQYNGPMYSQGPTAVGPYNLQGYQSTFGYNPQQTYLIDRLQPCPTPAYVVPNPNGYYGCQQNGYQSCGC